LKERKMSKESYPDRIKGLVEETVDKMNELLDEFNEKVVEIVKDASDSERVEKLVDKIAGVRKDVADGTADVIKSVTRAIVDTGESIVGLIKRDEEDD